jgi:putative transposase
MPPCVPIFVAAIITVFPGRFRQQPVGPRGQNPYVERLVGTLRRELLDHVIVLNEAHLKRLMTSDLAYYHESRTHLSLDRNASIPRDVEPPERGEVISAPQVGGLHHRYSRHAA